MTFEHLKTDVLVVGGGLAGLRAALAARDAGAAVAVVVKGKLGRSGCSAMTTAGYAAVFHGDDEDDVETFMADTHRGGAEVGDPDLIDVLCHESAAMVERLVADGGAFAKDEGGKYARSPSGDHSASRVLATPRNVGTDLTVPLAERVVAAGVLVLENTFVTELAVDDGTCVGAFVYQISDSRHMFVEAGSVLLATGGAGRLYSVSSNPNDVTGDGFALAARAGASLRDMEFIQFYPWRCIDPFDRSRVSIQPSTFVHGAKMYNAVGDRFMEVFNPAGAEVTTRDVAARGIFDQVRNGLGVGGGVRLDLSPLDEETFWRSNPKVAKLLKGKGIDYRTYPFIVTPEAHFFMGGLDIDSHGATSIAGLFAAGEVAGGCHGANRLNSNALPETQVFGARAGRAAAAAAADAGSRARVRGSHPAHLDGKTDPRRAAMGDLKERLAELQDRMWRHLGIIRRGAELEEGLDFVRDARKSLPNRPEEGPAVKAWYELRSLYDTAELCLTAALNRTESRGAHFREDFPSRDDAQWKTTLLLQRVGDEVVCRTRPLGRSLDQPSQVRG